MATLIIAVFVIGYLLIVFEHPIKLDKTVPAIAIGVICWTLLALSVYSGNQSLIDAHGHFFSPIGQSHEVVDVAIKSTLMHHLGKIAEILVFLIGAMTIVEIIDLHRGFDVIKKLIKTKKKKHILWITGIVAFFLSGLIDNLTTTIIFISILRKLIDNREERIWYVSLIITSANAGGAWSPIGDVTTTMLWIDDKVSAFGLAKYLLLPSIICLVVPYLVASFLPIFKGEVQNKNEENLDMPKSLSSRTMLIVGLLGIAFVPIYKIVTDLPPYLGMLLSLSVVWAISEYVHPEEEFTEEKKKLYSAHTALSRIEMSSILFFLGILLAVTALEATAIGELGVLRQLAATMEAAIPDRDIVGILLGITSAIIDNVPLVAASMSMFTDSMDAKMWHLICYAAGTGGSMLIIGSAAGVAAMGMEKINFIWYLKKITWLAALGYFAGIIVFLIQFKIFG